MDGEGLISLLLMLLIWGLPLMKKVRKARREVAAPAASNGMPEMEDASESWTEMFDEEESEWDEEFDEEETEEDEVPVHEQVLKSEMPFGNYFSYESEQPEATEKKEPQAEPASEVKVEKVEAPQDGVFEFDLRKAVIYQTILQNNYLSE